MSVNFTPTPFQAEFSPQGEDRSDAASQPPIGAMVIDAFCERYGPSRSKAYEEIAAGRLRTKKLGRRTLITVADAEAWLASLPDGSANGDDQSPTSQNAA